MKHKNLLLTFDFELFLGARSGSVEMCLLKPTKEVMTLINKYNLSTIFFVDTLYLHRLKEISKTNKVAACDYGKIISLLKELIDQKSYIFHHIHPHWLDAIYIEEINEWDVSNKTRFAINNLLPEEILEVFSYSDAILEEIYDGKTRPDFFGFRAGGLYSQPFENYKDQFVLHNIKYDFSVLRNAKSSGDNGLYAFDYSVLPTENIYCFSQDMAKKDVNGPFVEILMNQFQLRGIRKLLNGLYYRKNYKKNAWQRWGDGKASGNSVKSTKKSNKLYSEETFSIELLNNYKADLYINEFKKRDFLQIISHPKLFSESNIVATEKFLHSVKKKYDIESDLFMIIERSNISF